MTPNAYLLRGSEYLPIKERDAALVRATQYDGYLVPLNRLDIAQKYQERFNLEEVFDPIMDLSEPLRRKTEILNLKRDLWLRKQGEVLARCNVLGILAQDREGSADPSLMMICREEGLLRDQVQALEKEVGYFGAQTIPRQITQGVKAVSLGDFLMMELPPREFLLYPIIPTQGLVLLHAQRGVGKTYAALGIAYAVATGGNYLRFHAPTPKRVLYIDGEMPAITMQQRLALTAKISGQPLPNQEIFKLITSDLQDSPLPDLSRLEGQAAMKPWVQETDLIIVDNLSSLCRTGVENEAESWEPVQQWALELRRTGKSVLFVHHSGKSGKQRGSSKREDVLDTIVLLQHPKNYSPEEGARFEVLFSKARGFLGDDASPFEAKLITTADGESTWSCTNPALDKTEAVLQLHKDGLSVRDIEKKLEISKSTVQRIVDKVKPPIP